MERDTSAFRKAEFVRGSGNSVHNGASPRLHTSSVEDGLEHHRAVPSDLLESKEFRKATQDWLGWQCSMVSGVICGAVFFPDTAQKISAPLAQWPENYINLGLLSNVASQTFISNSSTVYTSQEYGETKGQTCTLVACPLVYEDKLIAVVSLMIAPRTQAQSHAVLQLLEWGSYWIISFIRSQISSDKAQADVTAPLFQALMAQENSKAVIIEAVNFLNKKLSCKRVSIGLNNGVSTRLAALSNSADFDHSSQLSRQLEAVMDEASDQQIPVGYPIISGFEDRLSLAHASLCKSQYGESILTIPLLATSSGKAPGPSSDPVIGAIVFEKDQGEYFDSDFRYFASAAGVISSVLQIKLREERSAISKAADSLGAFLQHLLGRSFLATKLILASLIALVTVLANVQVTHQVSAKMTLQGDIRQLLVAPGDGYISQSHVTPGQNVLAGQVMATLDNTDLILEKQKWQSELSGLKKEYQQAFAKKERTRIGILRAQMDKVGAEIGLIDDKLSRTEIVAPFDGFVVKGDLTQSQGAPVTQGDVLFEVAPLDDYRVILKVDEHDIANLDNGQRGEFVMSALPEETFGFTLTRVIPVSISEDGYNYFRVEGDLDALTPQFRPGMNGVAKIDISERSLLWVLTHKLADRFRLWTWSMGVAG